MSYYRRNRYDEWIQVDLNTCSSCAHYRFEREDETNYCSEYGRYYPVDEPSCSRWERSDEVS